MLNLDHLKEGIGLRGWGQKTPLIEYKREAFDMFKEMMAHIKFDIVHHIFHLNMTQFDERVFEELREQEMDQLQLNTGEVVEEIGDSPDSVSDQAPKVGRNEECSCGSGKKYKRCHGS